VERVRSGAWDGGWVIGEETIVRLARLFTPVSDPALSCVPELSGQLSQCLSSTVAFAIAVSGIGTLILCYIIYT